MKRRFNLFGLLGGRDCDTINLRAELEKRQDRLVTALEEREKFAKDPDLTAHEAFSYAFTLRMDAAVAARIIELMNAGQTQLRIRPGQTVDTVLLGAQAKKFSIYDRDVARDLDIALTA